MTTREALLAAGLRSFAESGYTGARLSDIVGQVGLTTGAFYRHFESKRDFYVVLQAAYAEELEEALERASSLQAQVESWLRLAERHRGLVRASHEAARPGTAESEDRRAERSRIARRLEHSLVAELPVRGAQARALSLTLTDVVADYVRLEAFDWVEGRPPREVAAALNQLVKRGLYLRGKHRGRRAGAGVEPEMPPRRDRPRSHIDWTPAPGRSDASTPRGRRTRARILRSALFVFGRRGFAETSMLDIAEHAKLASGTVYQYFKDKQDLFSCLLQELADRLYRETRMPAGPSGRLVVEESVLRYLAIYREYAAIFRAWLELLEPPTPFTDLWLELHHHWHDQMRDALRLGQTEGLIGKRIELDVTATLIVCAFDRPAYNRIVLAWDKGPDKELVGIMSHLLGTGFAQ